MNVLTKSEPDEILWWTLTNELEEQPRSLLAELEAVESGCALLWFLNSQAHTWLTLEDIAYNVGQPCDIIASALESLEELGLVEQMTAVDVTLYRITAEPQQRELLNELCEWQARWHAALERVDRTLAGYGA